MQNLGIYPPQVKVYELRELALKFERHLDSQIIDFEVLCLLLDFICHATPYSLQVFPYGFDMGESCFNFSTEFLLFQLVIHVCKKDNMCN